MSVGLGGTILLKHRRVRAWRPYVVMLKCEKGIWWMPWRQEAMKDVTRCDKPWGAASKL